MGPLEPSWGSDTKKSALEVAAFLILPPAHSFAFCQIHMVPLSSVNPSHSCNHENPLRGTEKPWKTCHGDTRTKNFHHNGLSLT